MVMGKKYLGSMTFSTLVPASADLLIANGDLTSLEAVWDNAFTGTTTANGQLGLIDELSIGDEQWQPFIIKRGMSLLEAAQLLDEGLITGQVEDPNAAASVTTRFQLRAPRGTAFKLGKCANPRIRMALRPITDVHPAATNYSATVYFFGTYGYAPRCTTLNGQIAASSTRLVFDQLGPKDPTVIRRRFGMYFASDTLTNVEMTSDAQGLKPVQIAKPKGLNVNYAAWAQVAAASCVGKFLIPDVDHATYAGEQVVVDQTTAMTAYILCVNEC